ncbi:MAG: carboxypeptidase regulatory-like domain-containing protein [Blastocatellales bacterium]
MPNTCALAIRLCSFASTALLAMVLATSGYGQGITSITGRVTDPNGAVVAGAMITATETRTGFSRSVVSNENGYYTIPSLRPAEYKLVIEAKGFRRYERAGIILQVDQTATLNLTLEVGVTTDTVLVQADANQVDLQTPTLKQVVEERRINELPLDGRNAATLALLVAGVMESPSDGAIQGTDKTVPGAVAYTTNGSRQNQINFKLDGADNMDGYTNVNQPFPFPDALQEFSVQTSNYSAELGSQSGGAVNVITKSGSNQFHGNGFVYHRNEVLNARNFFSPVRDKLKRTQYGGTVGGPIIRNRTFFFVGYQGTELRNIRTAGSSVIPTIANMAGDFSALLDANSPNNPLGRATYLRDPLKTGTCSASNQTACFPGNIIPTNRFDPTALKMLKFVPEVGQTGGAGRVQFPRPIRTDNKSIIVRLDDNLTEKDRLTGRFNFEDYDEASTYNGISIVTLNPEAVTRSQNALIQETHTFRPNLINEFRVSYARVHTNRRRPKVEGATSTDVGIRNPFLPETGDTFGVDVRNFFQISNTNQLIIIRNSYMANDDVKWVKGRHNLAFGGMYQLSKVDLALPRSIPFMRIESNSRGTSYAIADFLIGQVSGFFTQSLEQARRNKGWFFSLYVQDDFRISSRLSLSLGLRYDPYFTWGSPTNQVRLFSLQDALAGKRSRVFVNAPPGLSYPGDPDFPKNGATGDHNNLAPRLGFAYALTGDGRTSLRGGAGIYYDQRPPAITFNLFQGVFPWSFTYTLTPPPGPLSDPLRGATLPIFQIPPTSTAPFPSTLSGGNSLAPYEKSTSPITYNWNLTIERQLIASTLARISYVGSRANHIGVPIDLNPGRYIPGSNLPLQERRVIPTIGGVRQTSQEANSIYHGFQASLEKRFSSGNSFLGGATLLASYTFSKSMDDFPHGADPTGNTGGSDIGTLPAYDPNRRDIEYGPSRYDRKHRFVASYIWDLPKLQDQNVLLRGVVGGWQTTGIFQYQSGLPITVLAGQDRSQTGINQDRAQYLGGAAYGTGGCRPGEAPCVDFLNPAAFGLPPLGSAGNAGKGMLRGPDFWTWDMGFLKNIQITERMRVQLRVEFFNIFNHTNFVPLAGQNDFNYSRAGFGGLRSAGDPRIGQAALKIYF